VDKCLKQSPVQWFSQKLAVIVLILAQFSHCDVAQKNIFESNTIK
jgi:hypothetical protein